jgi:hypothetical protein
MAARIRAGQTLSSGRSPRRPRATPYRRRRITFGLVLLVLCFVVGGTLVALFGGRGPATQAAVAKPIGSAAGGEAHPVFALFGQQQLRLPVAAQDATLIGYEPTSDAQAVSLSPQGTQAAAGGLAGFFARLFSTPASIRYYLLESPGTDPTGSVDVGAPAGSAVTSPVTGTVAGVESYKLFGKYDDVEIDIAPDATSGTTVSLILIADPTVGIGATVTAGRTALGKVRACPPDLKDELGRYTHDSGAHVHLEVTQQSLQGE